MLGRKKLNYFSHMKYFGFISAVAFTLFHECKRRKKNHDLRKKVYFIEVAKFKNILTTQNTSNVYQMQGTLKIPLITLGHQIGVTLSVLSELQITSIIPA